MYILPLVVAIEIISFLSRPLSHSVRLFANMLAGHITLKVFAGFVALLGTSLGAVGWIGGMVPLALTVALTALELLVAFLQAYVFAILTCIYLNDALHGGHGELGCMAAKRVRGTEQLRLGVGMPGFAGRMRDVCFALTN